MRINNLKTYFNNFKLDEWNCTNSENRALNPESKLSPAILQVSILPLMLLVYMQFV